jgi:hypothetical protein
MVGYDDAYNRALTARSNALQRRKGQMIDRLNGSGRGDGYNDEEEDYLSEEGDMEGGGANEDYEDDYEDEMIGGSFEEASREVGGRKECNARGICIGMDDIPQKSFLNLVKGGRASGGRLSGGFLLPVLASMAAPLVSDLLGKLFGGGYAGGARKIKSSMMKDLMGSQTDPRLRQAFPILADMAQKIGTSVMKKHGGRASGGKMSGGNPLLITLASAALPHLIGAFGKLFGLGSGHPVMRGRGFFDELFKKLKGIPQAFVDTFTPVARALEPAAIWAKDNLLPIAADIAKEAFKQKLTGKFLPPAAKVGKGIGRGKGGARGGAPYTANNFFQPKNFYDWIGAYSGDGVGRGLLDNLPRGLPRGPQQSDGCMATREYAPCQDAEGNTYNNPSSAYCAGKKCVSKGRYGLSGMGACCKECSRGGRNAQEAFDREDDKLRSKFRGDIVSRDRRMREKEHALGAGGKKLYMKGGQAPVAAMGQESLYGYDNDEQPYGLVPPRNVATRGYIGGRKVFQSIYAGNEPTLKSSYGENTPDAYQGRGGFGDGDRELSNQNARRGTPAPNGNTLGYDDSKLTMMRTRRAPQARGGRALTPVDQMYGTIGGRASGGRPASAWISHVKAYASKHGVSYKDALSQASASYRK